MFQQTNAFAHVFDSSSSHNLWWFNRVHGWGKKHPINHHIPGQQLRAILSGKAIWYELFIRFWLMFTFCILWLVTSLLNITIHINPCFFDRGYILVDPRTWWLIPLSKWVTTPVINGISRVNPLITGLITHLLSGMSHQVVVVSPETMDGLYIVTDNHLERILEKSFWILLLFLRSKCCT